MSLGGLKFKLTECLKIAPVFYFIYIEKGLYSTVYNEPLVLYSLSCIAAEPSFFCLLFCNKDAIKLDTIISSFQENKQIMYKSWSNLFLVQS